MYDGYTCYCLVCPFANGFGTCVSLSRTLCTFVDVFTSIITSCNIAMRTLNYQHLATEHCIQHSNSRPLKRHKKRMQLLHSRLRFSIGIIPMAKASQLQQSISQKSTRSTHKTATAVIMAEEGRQMAKNSL